MWTIISGLFGSFSSYLVIGALLLALGGAGGTLWYRMQYHDCQASAANAIAKQIEVDRADNAKSIAQLNMKLEANETALQDATARLKNVEKTTVCGVTPALRATHDELCKLYPKSNSCR